MTKGTNRLTFNGLTFRLDRTERATVELFYRGDSSWEYLSEWRQYRDAVEAAKCFVPKLDPTEERHMGRDEWHPTWWRVVLPDGTLWMETSDPQEAQFGLIGEDGERQGHPPGARIQRLWERTESEWRDHEPKLTQG